MYLCSVQHVLSLSYNIRIQQDLLKNLDELGVSVLSLILDTCNYINPALKNIKNSHVEATFRLSSIPL